MEFFEATLTTTWFKGRYESLLETVSQICEFESNPKSKLTNISTQYGSIQKCNGHFVIKKKKIIGTGCWSGGLGFANRRQTESCRSD